MKLTNGQLATEIHNRVTKLTAQQRRTIVKILEFHCAERIKAAESISKMLRITPKETYTVVEIIMDGELINPLNIQHETTR
jgi:hypothetical protein